MTNTQLKLFIKKLQLRLKIYVFMCYSARISFSIFLWSSRKALNWDSSNIMNITNVVDIENTVRIWIIIFSISKHSMATSDNHIYWKIFILNYYLMYSYLSSASWSCKRCSRWRKSGNRNNVTYVYFHNCIRHSIILRSYLNQ